ncbi:hypothetical protein E3O44_00305 [Cryobacterium algoricola]|uniref:GtrA/DPMS transmembrane domain-containing protein n=1 Tax=Cryobacterium algoricola TaxID=1259183 RepID=A0ABY2IHH4_9MICO|nr:GtrA family protein [Cryobacterium algoricola]TFB91273.1 hypothetical protein E3O44_00305 [Cryobacterium algoricola]
MNRNGLRSQAFRYLLVGGTNTLLTYAIYIGLGLLIPAGIAFTIAYVIGLVWVVFGSSRLVFQADHSPKRLAVFAGWYLLVYAVGQITVQLISPKGVEALLWSSIAVIAITTPLTFFGGRMIFAPKVPDTTDNTRE